MSSADIPAGWYPPSDGSDRLRYWEGTRWTEHQTAATSSTADDKPNEPVLGVDTVPGDLSAVVQPLLAHLNETQVASRNEAVRAATAGSWRSNVVLPAFRDRMLVATPTAWSRLEPDSEGVWVVVESGEVEAGSTDRILIDLAGDLVDALNLGAPGGEGDIMKAVFDVRWVDAISNSAALWRGFDGETVLTLSRNGGKVLVGLGAGSGDWEVQGPVVQAARSSPRVQGSPPARP